MKKVNYFFAALCVISISVSSCNRGCGGWYGDRNLSYAPMEKSIDEMKCDETTMNKDEIEIVTSR